MIDKEVIWLMTISTLIAFYVLVVFHCSVKA
jgi:hypothetical protein